MDLSHVATLHLPGLTIKARQIHIFPKIRTAPLVLFGVLCDYGCTITLEQQDITFQNNEQQILKVASNIQKGLNNIFF